ncbi:hypothetical protein FVF58_07530 [Paraburkholderia panacisoli]|jgi:hypothetical protein|uniref:Secreted protein n=1 Tax=Paraburkholderia panacisoli TaxID=2603818 RepID=A0A5B0HET1_9BURK|nr:hypothetical protein [Paraburkholderia panacisoli]KAA1013590.1 hypothetical protein FVF58_07530 [Paraburkholderia panacisoli]
MKKIRSAEFLVGVAIVASAAALQMSENEQVQDAPPANAQAPMSSCGPLHDGLVPAGCEQPTRDERQTEHTEQLPYGGRQIWV